jgi:hypothetical protein
MAGQFDDLLKIYGSDSKPVTGPWKKGQKLVKNLGTGAKPDIAVGTWTGSNPDGRPAGTPAKMVVPSAIVDSDKTDNSGKDTNITQAAVNVARGRRDDIAANDLEIQRGELRGNARKRQIKGLGTTTMRLNETTGEAYDSEDVKPAPSGRVMPTRQANPKYLAADVQRQNEDLETATAADRRMSGVTRSEEQLGEDSFNASEKSSGSNLRSINGVTYDLSDWKTDGPAGIGETKPERPSASELQGASWAGSQAEAKAKANFQEYEPPTGNVSDYKPKKTAGELTAEAFTTPPTRGVTEGLNKSDDPSDYPQGDKVVAQKVDKIKARRGGKVYGDMIIDNIERESEGPTTVEYGDTLSEKNKKSTFKTPSVKETVERTTYKRPEKMYVEEDPDKTLAHLDDEAYDFRGENADSLSTTMREVQPEGPAAPTTRKVQIRRPGVAETFDKPGSARGNVIPQRLVDTYTGSDGNVDTAQAELENKNLRENRTPLTSTGPYDPNKMPSRDTFGKTPESSLIDAAKRETRAADLASQGKEMTTVAPHIMKSAVALAKSSRFNVTDENYLSSTQFLSHPAIQEATIAHAFGVHHDFSILHKSLGGKAPEIARRRNAWFKVADRKLRGNPEERPGEFDILGDAIRRGTTPTTVTRKLERGQKPGITLNGQSPTLADPAPIADVKSPTRAGTRRMHANTTANLMYQQQQSAKEAHKIMTFTPLKTTTMRLNETTGEAYDTDNKDEVLKNTAQVSDGSSAGPAPAGSDLVTVSNPKKGVPPTTRPFTKAERLNKGNVPSADDSKRRL